MLFSYPTMPVWKCFIIRNLLVMPSGSRWRSGSPAWNCTDSKLYCKAKRCKDRNGIMAGKTDLSGNHICTTTDGFVFEIFTDGKRNLFGVYGQDRAIWN